MQELIARKIDNNFVRIETDDYSIHNRIESHFRCKVPKMEFLIRMGRVPRSAATHDFYYILSKKFPIGLLSELEEFCKKWQLKLVKEDFERENKIDREDCGKFIDELIEQAEITLEKRDYQIDALKNSIEKERGIIRLATGLGKSFVIYSTIKFLAESMKAKKFILVVPNTSLVEQMFSDFKTYGWKDVDEYCEMLYSGKKPTFKKKMLITTWQSIYASKDDEFFKEYDCLLIDEVHNQKINQLGKITKKCVNARYRFGYTGTLPSDKYELFSIKHNLGDIIIDQGYQESIDEGFLSEMKINSILFKYPAEFISQNKNRSWDEEKKLVTEYPNRNLGIKEVIDKLPKNQNVLILANLIKHIDRMVEDFKKFYPDRRVDYIKGDVKTKIREEIRKSVEHEEGMILIATYGTCAAGINIKKLHSIVFADTSKSVIRILQSIGRGLRLHETKEKLYVWDIVDDMTYIKRTGKKKENYYYLHGNERLNIYKEQGFDSDVYTIQLK